MISTFKNLTSFPNDGQEEVSISEPLFKPRVSTGKKTTQTRARLHYWSPELVTAPKTKVSLLLHHLAAPSYVTLPPLDQC